MPQKHLETIFQLQTPPHRQPLTLDSAGITYPDANYRISRPNGAPHYILEYIISGCGHLTVADISETIEAGDVYLLTPGVRHEYHSDAAMPWHKIWFNIGGPLLDALLNAYRLPGNAVFRQCHLLDDFSAGLAIVRQREPLAHERLAQVMTGIFGKLNAHIQRRQLHAVPPDAGKLKEYLDADYCRHSTLNELAAHIGKSPAQTMRIFRSVWQCTPYEYIRDQKLELSQKYLLNSNHSLKMIASLLKFTDEFHFSNWFKRLTGCSPRQYRRNNQFFSGFSEKKS